MLDSKHHQSVFAVASKMVSSQNLNSIINRLVFEKPSVLQIQNSNDNKHLLKQASLGSLSAVNYFQALKIRSSSVQDLVESQNKLAEGLKSSVKLMLQNMIVRSKSSKKEFIGRGDILAKVDPPHH